MQTWPQSVHCMILSSTHLTVISHFISSVKEIGKYLSQKKKKEDRELQLNCTFIPYDYQSRHFPKIDPSAGLLSFSHSRNADTLWHDYYHIQSILVILTIIVLASNGMETYGKSKYHSLLLVFRDEANKACFKRILFLTTTLKKKAISPLRIDNS